MRIFTLNGIKEISNKKWENIVARIKQISNKIWGIIIVAGILVAALDANDQLERWLFGMDIDMAWYSVDTDGGIEIVSLNNVEIVLSESDLLSGRINIPLNLALKNNTSEPLEIVRVELTYDKSLAIKSEAKKLVSTQAGKLVFEHDLGELQVSKNFIPLPTIDVLSFPSFVGIQEIFILLKDGIPFYQVQVLQLSMNEDKDKLLEKNISIDLTIMAKNYGTISSKLLLNLDPVSFNITWPPDIQTKITNVNIEQAKKFRKEWLKANTLNSWEGVYTFESAYKLIKYKKLQTKSNDIVQLVEVDGVLKRVNVDEGGDGYQDYFLVDKTDDGVMDKKFEYVEKIQMIDWKKSSLE